MTSKALQAPKRRSRLNRLNGVDYAIMAFLALFALIILYPFYNSICVSLVSQADYIKTRFMLYPKNITLESYFIVFENGSIFDGMKVTIFITLVGVVYNMLLTVSLVGTGLGGFLHLLPLTFPMLVGLYAFWGFTSLFAFWPACVKAVRVLSSPEDKGKSFGWFEGGRGVTAAVMAPLAVVAFRIGLSASNMDDKMGMRYVIIFYSVLTVLSGLLVFWKMRDESTIEKSERITFRDLGKVLKMPAIWIIGLVTFCNYVFTLSLYYFTPYGTSILGMSVTFGAILAACKRFLCPVSNVGGGYLADKVGTSSLLFTSFIAMAVGTVAILFLPQATASVLPFVILFLVIYFFYNVNYALTWAMMDEGKIPERYSGTAAGIISTVGYLPEIFCSLLAGVLIDGYPGVTGYRYYFSFLIVMLLLGAGMVLVWKRFLKKSQDK